LTDDGPVPWLVVGPDAPHSSIPGLCKFCGNRIALGRCNPHGRKSVEVEHGDGETGAVLGTESDGSGGD
jgi:hypothetical protein